MEKRPLTLIEMLKELAHLPEKIHGAEVVERRSRRARAVLLWCLAGFGALVLISAILAQFSVYQDRRRTEYALHAFCSSARAEAATAPGFLDVTVDDLDRARGVAGDHVEAVYVRALGRLADEHPDQFPGCQPKRYCPQWLAAVDSGLLQADPNHRRTIRDVCVDR